MSLVASSSNRAKCSWTMVKMRWETSFCTSWARFFLSLTPADCSYCYCSISFCFHRACGAVDVVGVSCCFPGTTGVLFYFFHSQSESLAAELEVKSKDEVNPLLLTNESTTVWFCFASCICASGGTFNGGLFGPAFYLFFFSKLQA